VSGIVHPSARSVRVFAAFAVAVVKCIPRGIGGTLAVPRATSHASLTRKRRGCRPPTVGIGGPIYLVMNPNDAAASLRRIGALRLGPPARAAWPGAHRSAAGEPAHASPCSGTSTTAHPGRGRRDAVRTAEVPTKSGAAAWTAECS
jgi:hypothetical protein